MCDQFHLPVVNFVDVPGFVIGTDAERAGTIRRGSRGLFAAVRASVPWVSILVRKVYGVAGAGHGDGSRLNLRFAWPSGNWGSLPMAGGLEAAYRRELEAAEDPVALREEIAARLEAWSPFRTAERFSVEEIIDPRDTRPILCDWAERAHELVRHELPSGSKARGLRPEREGGQSAALRGRPVSAGQAVERRTHTPATAISAPIAANSASSRPVNGSAPSAAARLAGVLRLHPGLRRGPSPNSRPALPVVRSGRLRPGRRSRSSDTPSTSPSAPLPAAHPRLLVAAAVFGCVRVDGSHEGLAGRGATVIAAARAAVIAAPCRRCLERHPGGPGRRRDLNWRYRQPVAAARAGCPRAGLCPAARGPSPAPWGADAGSCA